MVMTEIESKIITKLVAEIIRNGFLVSVRDEEGFELRESASVESIVRACGHTKINWLDIIERGGDPIGGVLLIFGNEADVVADYTTGNSTLNRIMNWLEGQMEDM